jgi:hypothetical protein
MYVGREPDSVFRLKGSASEVSCKGKTDVIVLLDSSVGMRKVYRDAKAFVARELVDPFALSGDNGEGVYVFAKDVREVLDLADDKLSVDEKLTKIQFAPFLNQIQSNVGAALQAAVDKFKVNGIRKDAARVLILLTQRASADPNVLQRAVAEAKRDGITLIAVGVGSYVNFEELASFASKPAYFVAVSDWGAVIDLGEQIAKMLCQNK